MATWSTCGDPIRLIVKAMWNQVNMPYTNINFTGCDKMTYKRGQPCYFCGKTLKGNFRVLKVGIKEAKACGGCDNLFEVMFNEFIDKHDEAIRKVYAFISEYKQENMRFSRKVIKFKTPYKPKSKPQHSGGVFDI